MADEQSPIKIKKIGHVVYTVSDLERTSKFWTEIMGFKFSDKNENGMMFFRNSTDHHTIALIQATEKTNYPSGARWVSIIWRWKSRRSPSFSRFATF